MSGLNFAALPVFKDALGHEIAVGDLVSVAMMYGRSSGTQVVGWVEKLPATDRGKITIKCLDRGWKGNVQHRQPNYTSNKIVKLTQGPRDFDPAKHVRVDDWS